MRKIIYLLIILCLSSCVTTEKLSNLRQGMSKSEAVKVMGKPKKIMEIGYREFYEYTLYDSGRDLTYFLVLEDDKLIGWAPNNMPIPQVTSFIGSTDFAKYKKIAVMSFSDAPYSPHSGQIVQGLTSQILAKAGFEVIERERLGDILKEQGLSLSGVIDASQSIQLGKLLGAKAIVVGEAGQYETQQRKTDTVYTPFMGTIIPIQGQQWSESFVSISLRILDVETGQLIFSGSGHYNIGLTAPPQQLAENILSHILRDEWIISPGQVGIQHSKDQYVIKVLKNSPAAQSGFKEGDKIIKINNRDTSNLSDFEFSSLFWGHPREKITFDVERQGEKLNFEVIRTETQKDPWGRKR